MSGTWDDSATGAGGRADRTTTGAEPVCAHRSRRAPDGLDSLLWTCREGQPTSFFSDLSAAALDGFHQVVTGSQTFTFLPAPSCFAVKVRPL